MSAQLHAVPVAAAIRESPASKDSEMAVLGAVLLYPYLLAELADTRVDDFMFPVHRDVLEAMRAVEAVDSITVFDEMDRRGVAKRLEGGIAYLGELASRGSDLMFPHHLGIVHEKALARRLIATCLEAASRAYGGALVSEILPDHRAAI